MAKRTSKASATTSTRKVAKGPSPETVAMVRKKWELWRANHILSIMESDGISYMRAVKRSRRRLLNAEDKRYLAS